jgi:hypothetical protein
VELEREISTAGWFARSGIEKRSTEGTGENGEDSYWFFLTIIVFFVSAVFFAAPVFDPVSSDHVAASKQ